MPAEIRVSGMGKAAVKMHSVVPAGDSGMLS